MARAGREAVNDVIANSALPGGIVHLMATRSEAVTVGNKDWSILVCRVKLIQCAESVLLREMMNKLGRKARVDGESIPTDKTANDARNGADDSANDSNCLSRHISMRLQYR